MTDASTERRRMLALCVAECEQIERDFRDSQLTGYANGAFACATAIRRLMGEDGGRRIIVLAPDDEDVRPDVPVTFAARVQSARKAKGMSQAKLAEASGVRQQSIASIETGDTERPKRLHEIAKALDVSVDWLLYGDSE